MWQVNTVTWVYTVHGTFSGRRVNNKTDLFKVALDLGTVSEAYTALVLFQSFEKKRS